MRRVWAVLADIITAHYGLIAVAALLATAALAFGLPRIRFKTGQDTIVDPNSEVYQENIRYQHEFGGDPMLVLFEGDIFRLFTPENRAALQDLEAELNATGDFESVITPYTVVAFARDQVLERMRTAPAQLAAEQERAATLARAEAAARGDPPEAQEAAAQEARQRVFDEFQRTFGPDIQRIGAVGDLTLDNPKLVEFVVLDAEGKVRPELAGVFLDREHALMVARLAGNMSIDEQAEVAAEVVAIVKKRTFEGLTVTPTGSPLLIKEINDSMRTSMLKMAALAVLIMTAVLLLVFRARWRPLSLPVVLFGCVSAFGLMGLLGLNLTMVTISGLPILIGLGVDFAIQLHSRMEEETERLGDARLGLLTALERLGPVLTLALLAATIGFLVLHISRVPMIRDFGSMLAVGTFMLFVGAFFLVNSMLYLRDRARRPQAPRPARFEMERLVGAMTRTTAGRGLVVLAIAGFIAVVGVYLDRRLPVQTDPERFVPADSRVLRDLYRVRDVAGSSSELNFLVEAPDVTDPALLSWMLEFERSLRARSDVFLRSTSLASLVEQVTGSDDFTPEAVRRTLEVAPPAIRNTVVSDDHTRAAMVFAIGPISLQERKQVIDEIAASLNPPPGVLVKPAGLAVIGVEAVDALSANRDLMSFAALGAIFVLMAVAYRNPVRAIAPILPVMLALGSSSVVLYAFQVELNPLTSVSGPLIIAMGTEFSLLLMARYYEERERGASPREAMDLASHRIGRAITASGLTVMGGFGVLAFSGFPLLESFGQVTALNIGLSLLSALLVLPALLVWADEGFWARIPERGAEPVR